MSEPTPGTIELTCPGCQAYFRLKPKKGKFPKGPIPCPKCQTPIPLTPPKASSAPSTGVRTTQRNAPGSGVLSLGKQTKPSPITPKSATDPYDNSNAGSSSPGDAFLRAADQLLDPPSQSPSSTFQGFGLGASLGAVKKEESLESESIAANKNSTTDTSHFHREQTKTFDPNADTSHFHREDTTKAIDPDVIQAITKKSEKRSPNTHDTPIGGVDVMSHKTPVGGVPPIKDFSNPLDGHDDVDEIEPGPFDMRDIVEAERSKLENSDPNEITHNPLLSNDPFVQELGRPTQKPLPDDGFIGTEMSLGATETIAADYSNITAHPALNAEESDDEPLVSRSDIFTDASASPPDDTDDTTSSESAEEPDKESKPLAAMLRKKFSAKKLDNLRGTLNELSSPLSKSTVDEGDAFQGKPQEFISGADEDDLAKILDEADSKRASGEHRSVAEDPEKGPHVHPTKPALNVSEEISRRLANISPPSLHGDSDAEDSKPAPLGIGASLKKRIEDDRSTELEPGKPPSVKGSTLLARLKPNRIPASDITGDIPVAKHLRPHTMLLPDEASVPEEDAKSGSFNRFDLTPQRGDDAPSGVSWATADSVGSSAAFQNRAQSVTRRRRRQESHSGLFPISGGIGQEDSFGFASERKGSGYIRLPTSEIIDVLGKGQYRLLVEDIVYEPVDERGLTELVKRGVIMGAEKIAEPGGEWRPINEHPVFRRLKKRMAIEAHALLSKYRQGKPVTPELQDEELLPAEVDAPKEESVAPPPTPVSAQVEDMSDEIEPVIEEPASPPEIPGAAQPSDPIEEDDDDALIREAISHGELLEASEELAKDVEELQEPVEEPDPEESEPMESFQALTAPAFEEDALSESKRSPWLPIAGLLIVGALITAAVIYTQPDLRKQIFGEPTTAPVTDDKPVVKDTTEPAATDAQESPVATASQLVLKAAAIDLSSPATQLDVAKMLQKEGYSARALTFYRKGWTPDAERTASQSYADLLIEAGDADALRKLASEGIAKSTYKGFYEDLLKQADALTPATENTTPVELLAGMYDKKMTLLQSSKGLQFRLTDSGGQAWIFHPTQKRYSKAAAAHDLAAWRICQVITCAFTIPSIKAVNMSAQTFDAMMGDSGAAPASQRYAELNWTSGADKSVYGVLTRAIEPGAFWPFPYTNTWRPWLTAYNNTDKLNTPLADALVNMKRSDQALYDAMITQTEGMKTPDLARELSSVITFDFLANNMDRFKERKAYNGVLDNQIIKGTFYSLDHASAMTSRLSSRVQGRFDWVQRFDVEMIDSIRELDQEKHGAILFPEESGINKSEQKAFWKRRDKLLKEVDARATKYGKENVLFFK